jgi:hypothetical protein
MKERPAIKFSHNYPKLHGQTEAVLLKIYLVNRDLMTENFIEYDTTFLNSAGEKEQFPLPQNKYMVLVFMGNKYIPFTTARRYTMDKHVYYTGLKGQMFNVVIKPE